MATKVKEDALIKEKSISAPSTPRRGDIRHSRRPTIDSLVRDPSMLQEKPKPNYLKPTISSCHHSNFHYLKKCNSQPLEVSFMAGKSLPPRKPIDDKSPSPVSTSLLVPPKTSCGDRAKVSSDNGFENDSRKTLMRARSLPRVITKKRDINTDNFAKKSKCNEIQDHTSKKDVESSKQKLVEIKSPLKWKDNKNNKHYTGNGEEHKNEPSETAKNTKTHRAKAVANNCDGGKSKAMVEGDRKSEQERTAMLKRHDVRGKETQLMYNEVIEETASMLAAKRSKVKALVGAFETVISLQEPEGQLDQPHDDDEIEERRGVEIKRMRKDSRQQPVEMKNIEKETKQEKAPKDDQLDKHKLEKENTKGCETDQKSQQQEQESMANLHGQLIESQQQEQESMVNLHGQLIEQEEVDAAEFDQESQQDVETSNDGQNCQNSPQNEEGKGAESYEVEREESA